MAIFTKYDFTPQGLERCGICGYAIKYVERLNDEDQPLMMPVHDTKTAKEREDAFNKHFDLAELQEMVEAG